MCSIRTGFEPFCRFPAETQYFLLYYGKPKENTVKMAVNFGYDTDTIAAITGSIAGAMYGIKQIPELGEQFMKCIQYSDKETGKV